MHERIQLSKRILEWDENLETKKTKQKKPK